APERGARALGPAPTVGYVGGPGEIEMTTEATSPSTTRRVRGLRWRRRALLALLFLVLFLLILPFAAGPLLRGWLVSALEDRLAARVELQTVEFSWPAKLHLQRLVLHEEDGRPLASVDDVRASVEVLPLLTGALHADVAIAFPELHVARDPDGRWN